MKHYLITPILLLFLASCAKEGNFQTLVPNLPSETYTYFNDDELSTLGRVLFYDKNLSINKSVSCGSCHKQQFAFADNKAFSTGVNVAPTLRNSMSLSNLSNSNGYFWDQRTSSLSGLVFMPITNHIEMGIENVDALIANLRGVSYYPELFKKAYGSSEIDADKVETAIASFLFALRSYQSAYDHSVNFNASLSANAQIGKELFFGKAQCSSCHNGQSFGGSGTANIGLDQNYKDQGIGALSLNQNDFGVFKIPSLRNIELSAPYMHDGRFTTLEEVVQHYNTGIQEHPNLNWRFTEEAPILSQGGWWIEPENGGAPVSLNLSEAEQASLVSFLKTLTDHTFCTDIRFSDPFQR